MRLKFIHSNIIIVFFFFATVLITGCSNNNSKSEEDLISADSSQNKIIKINDEIFSVPSPFQFTSLIKKSGANYNKEILNAPDKVSRYSNNNSQALNLGIYSADLGYMIVYGQTQDVLSHLSTVKKMADALGLEQIFNESLVSRFGKNISNKDSLEFIIADAFLSTDAYLKDNNRMNTGGLILAGSWIESLYLTTQVYKSNKNELIKIRIAEQKLSLQSLIKSLTQSKVDHTLINQLKNLSTVYDEIEFKYIYEKPTTDIAKKLTTINSKTEINITDKQINAISEKITIIRNEIISGK